jgi:hypothetical protein
MDPAVEKMHLLVNARNIERFREGLIDAKKKGFALAPNVSSLINKLSMDEIMHAQDIEMIKIYLDIDGNTEHILHRDNLDVNKISQRYYISTLFVACRFAIIDNNIIKFNKLYRHSQSTTSNNSMVLMDAIRLNNVELIDLILSFCNEYTIGECFNKSKLIAPNSLLLHLSRHIADRINFLGNITQGFRTYKDIRHMPYVIWKELVQRLYSTNINSLRSKILDNEKFIELYPCLNIDDAFKDIRSEIYNDVDKAIAYLEELATDKYAPGSFLANEAINRLINKNY